MSLNDLILPPSLLQQLYPEGLITLPAAAPAGRPSATPKVRAPQAEAPAKALPPLLGGGAGRILIAVSDTAHPFLGEGALAFLTSVLGACRRSLADVQLFNTQRAEGWSPADLLEAVQPERVLLFGVPARDWALPPTLPPYEIFRSAHTAFLTAPALNAIESDKGEKGRLWNSLKPFFGL